jgi:hypothetical protein
MIAATSDFEKRKLEINEYFEFVGIVNSEAKQVDIKYKREISHTRRQKYEVSDSLQKVLIANGFLLLYNLIEATTRNAVGTIFNELEDNGIDYTKLSENLKKIFVRHKTSVLKDGTFNASKLNSDLFNITLEIISEEVVILSKNNLNFSGNLDARKIKKIATNYGFEEPTVNGDNLLTIKTKRNHLAHGDFSFSEIGKDYSIGDIIDFKNEAYLYLEEFIKNIGDFIVNQEYLAAS